MQEKNNQFLKPELSVVVLGYRAGESLNFFIDELVGLLENKKIDYEIVLVGNFWFGSNDVTPEVVRSLARENPRIKPVVKEKQGRMGWDMRSGFEAAGGDLVAVIDGDGQMLAADIIRVYQEIKQSDVDLVKTYRIKRGDGFWRRFISLNYNFLFAVLFPKINSRDINSKPKILKRNFFDKINLASNDWFADAEIMIKARRYKIKMVEIPTEFKENEKRPSFVKFPAIWEFIKNLIKYRIKEFKFNRRRNT